MRRTVAAVAMVLVVLALGACGSDGDEPGVRARSALAPGEALTLASGETVRVHGHESGVRPPGPAGTESPAFSVVDVEVCAGTDGSTSAAPAAFELEMPDGRRIAPASVVAREPALQVPRGPGQCSRGNISYEVGTGPAPAAVALHAPGTTVRWSLR